MRSQLKSTKKLTELLTLAIERKHFDVTVLTALLKQPVLEPDHRLLRMLLGGLVGSYWSKTFRENNTTELRLLAFERWFEKLEWDTSNFWLQLNKVARYASETGAELKTVAAALETFIRTNIGELNAAFSSDLINPFSKRGVYAVCIEYTMGKYRVSRAEFGWSLQVLECFRENDVLQIETDKFINNQNLPFQYRLHFLKKTLKSWPYAGSHTRSIWFEQSSSKPNERLRFAQIAAAHGAPGALQYLKQHNPDCAALVEMGISLELTPKELLVRIRASGALPESSAILPNDLN